MLAGYGGNVQSALMSAPKETRDYVPSVKRRLEQFGNMTASMGDTAPLVRSLVLGVPRGKGKAWTVQTRSTETSSIMQAQGIKITQDMRDQYLMTGKMPNTEDDPSCRFLDARDRQRARRATTFTGMMPPLGMQGRCGTKRSQYPDLRGGTGEWADGSKTRHATADLQEPRRPVVKGLQSSPARQCQAQQKPCIPNAELLVSGLGRSAGR